MASGVVVPLAAAVTPPPVVVPLEAAVPPAESCQYELGGPGNACVTDLAAEVTPVELFRLTGTQPPVARGVPMRKAGEALVVIGVPTGVQMMTPVRTLVHHRDINSQMEQVNCNSRAGSSSSTSPVDSA